MKNMRRSLKSEWNADFFVILSRCTRPLNIFLKNYTKSSVAIQYTILYPVACSERTWLATTHSPHCTLRCSTLISRPFACSSITRAPGASATSALRRFGIGGLGGLNKDVAEETRAKIERVVCVQVSEQTNTEPVGPRVWAFNANASCSVAS